MEKKSEFSTREQKDSQLKTYFIGIKETHQ